MLVDPAVKILTEAADGLGGPEDRTPDATLIELHQGAVSFLNFDNAILNWHVRRLYTKLRAKQSSSP
jgi:hypothetical protein